MELRSVVDRRGYVNLGIWFSLLIDHDLWNGGFHKWGYPNISLDRLFPWENPIVRNRWWRGYPLDLLETPKFHEMRLAHSTRRLKQQTCPGNATTTEWMAETWSISGRGFDMFPQMSYNICVIFSTILSLGCLAVSICIIFYFGL